MRYFSLLVAVSVVIGGAPAFAQLAGTDLKAGDTCTASQTGHVARNASATLNAGDITLICDGTEWVSARAAGDIQDYTDPQYGGNALVGLKGNQTTAFTATHFCLSEGFEAGIPLTLNTATSATLAVHDGDGWGTMTGTDILKTLRCFNAGSGGSGGGSLPALASASIWVGNGSNAATAVTMSGDATLSNAGVLNIANDAIIGPELSAGSVGISKISATGTASATTYLRGDGTWAAPSGGGGTVNYQAFTASGTWTKPASGSMALVQCWGAGGGGANPSGGGGGAYVERLVQLSALSSTETVTVASATGAGANGGNSSFGSWVVAYGGRGSSALVGGAGSSPVSAGTGGTGGGASSGGGSGPWGWSGGGGGGDEGAGGDSIYGGGGGGGDYQVGGLSLYGGRGGNDGQAGVAPGGGGGAGAGGARGECRVTVW